MHVCNIYKPRRTMSRNLIVYKVDYRKKSDPYGDARFIKTTRRLLKEFRTIFRKKKKKAKKKKKGDPEKCNKKQEM